MHPIKYLTVTFMVPALGMLYGALHSWGWSIIVLTVIVKAFLFPLTAKQFIGMRKMQKLQPQLQAIQKEFKDDPQEMQRRVMAFYQENNANPVAGCLPMVVQIPILWALYAAFMDKSIQAAVKGVSFLFIRDLSSIGIFDRVTHAIHWDSAVLLAVMGASTYLTQKMMTTNPNDPVQRQMLVMTPIMLTVMMAWIPVPAGVLLYWAVSNLLSIAQNAVLLRFAPAEASVPAAQAVIDVAAKPKDQKAR